MGLQSDCIMLFISFPTSKASTRLALWVPRAVPTNLGWKVKKPLIKSFRYFFFHNYQRQKSVHKLFHFQIIYCYLGKGNVKVNIAPTHLWMKVFRGQMQASCNIMGCFIPKKSVYSAHCAKFQEHVFRLPQTQSWILTLPCSILNMEVCEKTIQKQVDIFLENTSLHQLLAEEWATTLTRWRKWLQPCSYYLLPLRTQVVGGNTMERQCHLMPCLQVHSLKIQPVYVVCWTCNLLNAVIK